MRRYGETYSVIAPDQRGHGLSDKPSWGYRAEDMAADALGILRRLEAAPATVIGHSMGARIAGYLAGVYPEAVSSLALLDETVSGAGSRVGGERDASKDDGLTSSWPTPYPAYHEAVRHLNACFERKTSVDYFLSSLVETDRGYDYLFSRPAMAEIGRSYQDWRHLLPGIHCPVLLVRAAQSWCLPESEALEMRDALEDCTYVEIPSSDHMVYTDNPAAFYAAFDRFLARVSNRPAR